jgi:hypothetical protein
LYHMMNQIKWRTESIRSWMKGEIEMKAIEFVMKYETYIKEIEAVVRPEFKPIIQKMLEIDPHDLITPESYFEDENHAKGFVWRIFMKKAKKEGLI